MGYRQFKMIDGKLVQVGGDPVTAKDQARYRQNIKDIVETRKAPGGSTDETGFSELRPVAETMTKRELDYRIKEAAKRGEKFDLGKPYNPCLASYPGDTRAQVTSKSEMKRVLERKGHKVGRGPQAVYEATPRNDFAPAERCKLNPRIVNRIMSERVAEDPGLLKRKSRREVREQIVHEHGAK